MFLGQGASRWPQPDLGGPQTLIDCPTKMISHLGELAPKAKPAGSSTWAVPVHSSCFRLDVTSLGKSRDESSPWFRLNQFGIFSFARLTNPTEQWLTQMPSIRKHGARWFQGWCMGSVADRRTFRSSPHHPQHLSSVTILLIREPLQPPASLPHTTLSQAGRGGAAFPFYLESGGRCFSEAPGRLPQLSY